MSKRPLRDAFDRYLTIEEPGTELENLRELPLGLIDPNVRQARQSFDEAKLEELTASVRTYGVLQPIGVRTLGPRYQIIWGERRFTAATRAGLPTIPARIFKDVDDARADTLTTLENLQREDLDLEEEARQFKHLMQRLNLSGRALADHLGVSRNYVARRVRLLEEQPELFAAIREGRVTQRAALNMVAEYQDRVVSHGGTLSTDSETSAFPADGSSADPSVGAEVSHRGTLPVTNETSPPDGIHINGRLAVASADSSGDRTPRGAMPPLGPVSRWRDLARTRTFLGRIQPTTVPVEEQVTLLYELEELGTQVAVARRALLAHMGQAE